MSTIEGNGMIDTPYTTDEPFVEKINGTDSAITTTTDIINNNGSELPPMPSIPPPLPPMPNSLPPPPPPVDESNTDDINYNNDLISNANDTITSTSSFEGTPAVNIKDALGRSGMYTGGTMMDTSSQTLLPHGNNGVMLYDNKIIVSTISQPNQEDIVKPVKYVGEWMLGHWHGHGLLTYSTGDSYVGQWKTSYKHGQGTYTWSDGRQYIGQFEYDIRQGQGKYTWPTTVGGASNADAVISYTGNFDKNQRNGFGTYIDEVNGIEYTGEWRNGVYHGYGIYQWCTDVNDGKRNAYRGNFRNGKPDGQGIEILPDGTVRHEGLWDNGEPVLTDEQKREQRQSTQRNNANFVLANKTASSLLQSSSALMLSKPKQQQVQGNKVSDEQPLPPLSPKLNDQQPNSGHMQHSPKATLAKKKGSKKKKDVPVIVVQSQAWKDSTTGCVCTYRGLWDPTKNCPDGNGTAVYETGAVQTYEGQFKAGLYHGQGRLWYRNGDFYEGTFIAGQRHTGGEKDPITGKHATALYRWKDGRQYTGQFYANVRQGYGILVYANQDLYEGDFVAGQREGHGRFVFAVDGSCYTGEWQAGQYHGDGTLVMGNGYTYTGQFQNGFEQGFGCLKDAGGRVVYEGEWIRGKRRDEVDAAMQLLKEDAERKRAAVQEALSELDQLHLSGDKRQPQSANPDYSTTETAANQSVQPEKSQRQEVPVFRDWNTEEIGKSHSKKRSSKFTNRDAIEEGDNRPCEAVVNEPVTDLLGCPGYYTGIVDSQTRLPHGVGRLVYADGKRIHEGFWKEGSKHGHGRCLFFPQGDYHEGEYKNNLRHGPGTYQWQDGRSFNGYYVNDLRDGHGVFIYPGGERYEGNFSKGQRSGFGRFDFIDPNNGNKRGYYEGLWKDGLYSGAGHIVWGDGVSYTGQFHAGTFHGKGIKRYATGNVIREGYWNHGVACDKEDLNLPDDDDNDEQDGEERKPQLAGVEEDVIIETQQPASEQNQQDSTLVSEENASMDSLAFSDSNEAVANSIDSTTEEKKDEHDDASLSPLPATKLSTAVLNSSDSTTIKPIPSESNEISDGEATNKESIETTEESTATEVVIEVE